MQSTFFCLGKYLKKLADDQRFSITKEGIYHIKHMHIQPFTAVVDWPVLMFNGSIYYVLYLQILRFYLVQQILSYLYVWFILLIELSSNNIMGIWSNAKNAYANMPISTNKNWTGMYEWDCNWLMHAVSCNVYSCIMIWWKRSGTSDLHNSERHTCWLFLKVHLWSAALSPSIFSKKKKKSWDFYIEAFETTFLANSLVLRNNHWIAN